MSKERAPRRGAEYWRVVVSEISSSNFDVKQACAERGVSLERYYYWRRRFRKTEGVFQEVSLPQLSTEEIEVRIGTTLRVVIRGALTTTRLTTILKSVQEVS